MANLENSSNFMDDERQFRSSREINNLTTEIIQEEGVKQDEFQIIMSILNNSTHNDVNLNDSLLIQFNYDSGLTRQFLYNDLIQDYPDFPKLLCNCIMKKEGKIVIIVLPEGIKEKNLENYLLSMKKIDDCTMSDLLSILKTSESFQNTSLMSTLVYEFIIPKFDLSNIVFVYKKSYKLMTRNIKDKICFDLFYNSIVFVSKNLLFLIKNERNFMENTIDKKVLEEIIEKFFKENNIKDLEEQDNNILIAFLINNYKVNDLFNLIKCVNINLNKQEVIEETMLINPVFSINNINYTKKQFQNKQNDLLTITVINEEIYLYLTLNNNNDPFVSYYTIAKFTNGESNICFTKLTLNLADQEDYLICKAKIPDLSNIELTLHVKYCFTYSNLIQYLLINNDKYYFDKKINNLPQEVFVILLQTLKKSKSNNTLVAVVTNWLFDLNNINSLTEVIKLIRFEHITLDTLIYFCVKLSKLTGKKQFFKKFKESIENTIAEFYKEGYNKLKIKESVNIEFLIYFKTVFAEYIFNSIIVASKHLDYNYYTQYNSFDQTRSNHTLDSQSKHFNLDISQIKKTDELRFISLGDNNSIIETYLNETSINNIHHLKETCLNKAKRVFNNLSKVSIENITFKSNFCKKRQNHIEKVEQFAITNNVQQTLPKKEKAPESKTHNSSNSNTKLYSVTFEKTSRKEKSPNRSPANSNNNLYSLPFKLSRNESSPLKHSNNNSSRKILYSPSMKFIKNHQNSPLKAILNSLTTIHSPSNKPSKKESSTINSLNNATSRISNNHFPIKLTKNTSSSIKSPAKFSSSIFSSSQEKSLKKVNSSFKSPPLGVSKNEKTPLVEYNIKSVLVSFRNIKKDCDTKKLRSTIESRESNDSNKKFNTINGEINKALSQQKNSNKSKNKVKTK